MTLLEYQEQAKRTCPTLGSDKLDLAHMVLGICSEFEEFFTAKDLVNKSEETADMCWYIANYCTFRGYSFEELFLNGVYNEKNFGQNISILQDYIKKYIAYNKEINREKEIEIISCLCGNIGEMFGNMNIKQSLQNNIDKLRVRFPDKFDENLAKNRNLEAERKELEK